MAWKAYVFCVLESFHRLPRRRELFAKNSSKWGDPRAKLLDGEAWEQVRPTVLASLNLPGEPGEHLAARAALLDGTYREVVGRVPATSQIVFDDDGRLHFAALQPDPEPASLTVLRKAVEAMMPRVDLPEVLLEVFSWTGADQAFTSITGGEARLKDLHVTVAALLVAHGCNVGYTPVIGEGVPAAVSMPAGQLALAAALLARMLAWSLLGWRPLQEIDLDDETWQVGVESTREIQRLSVFGEAGRAAAEETDAASVTGFLRQQAQDCMPIDLAAFYAYHRGGKVNRSGFLCRDCAMSISRVAVLVQVPPASRTAHGGVLGRQGASLTVGEAGQAGVRAHVARADDLARAGAAVGDEHRSAGAVLE